MCFIKATETRKSPENLQRMTSRTQRLVGSVEHTPSISHRLVGQIQLNIKNTCNIYHFNLDGLESKFELLHNFINTTKLSLDVTCLCETSQKLNQDFGTNVMINGYKNPYTTGSKFIIYIL